MSLMKMGEMREAERQLRAAAAKAPKWTLPRLELARLLFDPTVGALFEAFEQVEAALALDPEDAEAGRLHADIEAALRDRASFVRK